MFTQWSLDLKEQPTGLCSNNRQHTLLMLRYKNTGETLTFPAGSSDDVQLQLILQIFAPSKLICGGML